MLFTNKNIHQTNGDENSCGEANHKTDIVIYRPISI